MRYRSIRGRRGCAQPNANSDRYANQHSYADPDCDEHAEFHTNLDAYRDTHSDSDANRHANSHFDADAYPDAHPDQNTDTYRNPDANSDADAIANPDAHPDQDADADRVTDANPDADAIAYTDVHPDQDADAHPIADADADRVTDATISLGGTLPAITGNLTITGPSGSPGITIDGGGQVTETLQSDPRGRQNPAQDLGCGIVTRNQQCQKGHKLVARLTARLRPARCRRPRCLGRSRARTSRSRLRRHAVRSLVDFH